jgi:uncharacterized protein
VIAVDVTDLLDRPGASRRVIVREPVDGLRLELAHVPDGAPVAGDLLLESVVEGILVSGQLTGQLELSCARCLTSFPGRVVVDVQELFALGASPGDDEYPLAPEGSIALEPLVRDGVLLAMPSAPLCRPGCLGLCERCGGDRNLGECSCEPETADPRWAVLEGLFEDSAG